MQPLLTSLLRNADTIGTRLKVDDQEERLYVRMTETANLSSGLSGYCWRGNTSRCMGPPRYPGKHGTPNIGLNIKRAYVFPLSHRP